MNRKLTHLRFLFFAFLAFSSLSTKFSNAQMSQPVSNEIKVNWKFDTGG